MSTSDLLNTWREASRAAEVAAQLAKQAVESAATSDLTATAAEEIADLAERAAEAADTVARRARAAADEARRVANHERDQNVPNAAAADMEAMAKETDARDAYHRAEGEARTKRPSG